MGFSSTNSNAFEMLAEPVKRLVEEKGFMKPTDPQARAIKPILEGKNVLLIAATGTGKTEAAFLPVLSKLLEEKRIRGVKVLYITPLRALNRDLMDRLQWWCSKLDLSIGVRHGDTSMRERRTQADMPPDILVTTPETLQIMLVGRKLRENLLTVRHVIIDEIHELAESKRGAQLALALERLKWLKKGNFQIIGLSATVGSPEEVARFLVGSSNSYEMIYVPIVKLMRVKIAYPKPTPEDIKLASKLYTYPDVAARLRCIKEIVESSKSCLIFTNTRPMTEVLGSRFKLWDVSIPINVHHGSLALESRLRAERGLKSGTLKALIATSSLELGIDIGSIDMVIQYNSPRQATRLVQRVGRSGHRVGAVSKGTVIVQNPDDAIEALVVARRAMSDELEPVKIPEKPLDALMHEIAGFLLTKKRWAVDEAYVIIKGAYNYRNLEFDEFIELLRFMAHMRSPFLGLSFKEVEFFRVGPPERIYTYYFENLSMIPDVKQYLVIDQDSEEPVGVLDEPFVAEYGKPGVKFIMAGEVWSVVQVFEDRVYVKNAEDPLGAVPSWVGEEIPVPYEVAQEVGSVRRFVEERFEEGKDLLEIARELSQKYRSTPDFIARGIEPIFEQCRLGYLIPNDKRIVVEAYKDLVTVHVLGGTLINRALSRFLSEALTERFAKPVAVSEDPYRIYLKGQVSPEEVSTILKEGSGPDIAPLVRRTMEKSGFFRFRITQAARKMGILEKGATLSREFVDNLIDALRDTPVYKEAFREAVERDIDLKGAEKLLMRISKGEIEVICLGELEKPTPIAKVGVDLITRRLEKVPLERKRTLKVAKMKVELLSQLRTFACLECKGYVEEIELHRLEDEPRCPICGSKLIGMADADEFEVGLVLTRAREGVLDKESRRIWRDLKRSASLISKFGKVAAIALVSGLPQKRIDEILEKEPRLSSRFYELLYEERKELSLRRFRQRWRLD